jgi:hypothetical protein
MRKIVLTAVAMAISVLTALAFCEISLRIFLPQQNRCGGLREVMMTTALSIRRIFAKGTDISASILL